MSEFAIIYISSDGQISIINKDKTKLDVRELQSLVNGWIELVKCHYKNFNLYMAVDDEGLLKFKPINRIASMLYNNGHDVIAGDVVIGFRYDISFYGDSMPDIYAMPYQTALELVRQLQLY